MIRIRLTLSKKNQSDHIMLPLSYNKEILGFLYHTIANDQFAAFLHDTGYMINDKQFKLFTFSRITSAYERKGNYLFFGQSICFEVSAATNEVASYLQEGLAELRSCRIGTNDGLRKTGLEVVTPPRFSNNMRVKVMSPIVVKSKEKSTESGLYYVSPLEKSLFSSIVERNIQMKRAIVDGIKPEDTGHLSIERVSGGYNDAARCIYKDNVLVGYLGEYVLKGDPRLLQISYYAGLGDNNSIGFGMWKMANHHCPTTC